MLPIVLIRLVSSEGLANRKGCRFAGPIRYLSVEQFRNRLMPLYLLKSDNYHFPSNAFFPLFIVYSKHRRIALAWAGYLQCDGTAPVFRGFLFVGA